MIEASFVLFSVCKENASKFAMLQVIFAASFWQNSFYQIKEYPSNPGLVRFIILRGVLYLLKAFLCLLWGEAEIHVYSEFAKKFFFSFLWSMNFIE